MHCHWFLLYIDFGFVVLCVQFLCALNLVLCSLSSFFIVHRSWLFFALPWVHSLNAFGFLCVFAIQRLCFFLAHLEYINYIAFYFDVYQRWILLCVVWFLVCTVFSFLSTAFKCTDFTYLLSCSDHLCFALCFVTWMSCLLMWCNSQHETHI